MITELFNKILSFFVNRRSQDDVLFLIDGDQSYRRSVAAFTSFASEDARGVWVNSGTVPRCIKNDSRFDVECIRSMASKGKESTDKYIAVLIQKAVSAGQKKITVISSDYDFVDIFKMIERANPEKRLELTMVAPDPKGRIHRTRSTKSIKIVRL